MAGIALSLHEGGGRGQLAHDQAEAESGFHFDVMLPLPSITCISSSSVSNLVRYACLPRASLFRAWVIWS